LEPANPFRWFFLTNVARMERQVGPVGGICKRVFDCALALMALAIMSPIMLMTALLIVITMGRPIFSTQQSIGFNGSFFTRLKFRTTIVAEGEPGDRVDMPEEQAPCRTFVGRMLSDSGLEGLPQFFNILAGHMSFVGPPCLPANGAAYCLQLEHSAGARPGLTSRWQISR
jgi:lipopolysaccharide/colanic/teichoic acid biosynthesis glycosyltransferase